MDQMKEYGSSWVLCPSKKLPGRYYYFNTQTGEKAWSWTMPSGQTPNGRLAENPKQRQTPDGRTAENLKQRQTPDRRIAENLKQRQTPDGRTAENPYAQSSFGKAEFPKYLHNQAINPRKSFVFKSNLNKPIFPMNNPNLTSRSKKSGSILQFKSILNNPFSLGLSESLKTNSNQLCEGSPSKKSVFEPIFDYNFLPKRRLSTDIEELSQAIKKAKICSPPSSISEQDNLKWNPDKVKSDVEFDDDSLLSTTQYRWHRNENVKVSINFLRNLSTFEYTDVWYLVPDIEVLLENLNFIKKFIAGDRTCSLMTPAVVLAKLQSLRDDNRAADNRAAIAEQVYLWLVENSLCESDNHLDSSLDDVTVHKQIIEYCIQANKFHLVIITNSKSLWNLAKRNDIHVYYLNALKIINQKENLFLLDPDSAESLKWPTSPSVINERNNKKNTYENFEICVNQNGKRIIVSPTSNEREHSFKLFEGNVKKNDVRTSNKTDFEGYFVERNLREFSTKHANLQNYVIQIIDECTCSFLQIMEHCLHNIMKLIPETQFDPPCWLYEGLQVLKKYYYQKKILCAIVDRLISMCGFYKKNDIMRPNIKSDRFIQILGAGILLIKEFEKTSPLPELSDCDEMLIDLIGSIETAQEFPEELSISLECRQRLGDEPFRMGRDETAENSYDHFVSDTEIAPQHEVITNTEPDYNMPLLLQNQHELFDVEGCCGSIKLFRNDMVDGDILKPNHIDSRQDQDKTIQSTGSNLFKTIQSTGSNLYKTIQSTGSNLYKTIKSTGSNQYKTIQSTGSNQFKTVQSTGSNLYKTIESTGSNQYKTIQSTGYNQFKTIQSTGSNLYKTIESTGSNQYKTIQSTGYNQFKTIQSTGSNLYKTIESTGSNQFNTIQSTGSNQYNTIQSTGSNQYKTIESSGSNEYKTIQSIGSNQYKTIQSIGSNQDEISQSILCNQNKSDVVLQHSQDTLISSNVVSYESGSRKVQSENILTNGISQTSVRGDALFQKLENTVDMIRMALTKMKHFIEHIMEELNKGGISERRKECLRETSDRFRDCATGMFQALQLIQKRENPNDSDFGKKFAARNPAYTECIERCLEQVVYMHTAFGYVLEALK